MQRRRQPQPAPLPGALRPAAPLLLLALLALPRAAASPEGPGDPAEPGPPRALLALAARAALHFVNFRAGSPSALRGLAAVQRGRAQMNPQKRCSVDLVFTTESYHQEEGEQHLGKCSARVVFRNQKPRPIVNATCTRLMGRKARQEEDYQLYLKMKQLHTLLDVSSIPDSYGYVDPSLRPIWDLALLGGSYVMWEKTTQLLHYHMVQVSSVEQWKTDDDAVDFDYTALLHETPTQEIVPCRIHLVWHPSKSLKVKYRCQGSEMLAEASGTGEGSATAPQDAVISA